MDKREIIIEKNISIGLGRVNITIFVGVNK